MDPLEQQPVRLEQQPVRLDLTPTPLVLPKQGKTSINEASAAFGQTVILQTKTTNSSTPQISSLGARRITHGKGMFSIPTFTIPKWLLIGSLATRKALLTDMEEEVTGNKSYPLQRQGASSRTSGERIPPDKAKAEKFADTIFKNLWITKTIEPAKVSDRLQTSEGTKKKGATNIQIHQEGKTLNIALEKGQKLYYLDADGITVKEIRLSRFPITIQGMNIKLGRHFDIDKKQNLFILNKNEQFVTFSAASNKKPIIIEKDQRAVLVSKDKITVFDSLKGIHLQADDEIKIIDKEEQLIRVGGETKAFKRDSLPLLLMALLEKGDDHSIYLANEIIPQMQAIRWEPKEGKSSGHTYDNSINDFPICHLTTTLSIDADIKKSGRTGLSDVALKHLFKELLLLEGEEFDWSAPNTEALGIVVRETENHLLMGRGSAYLKMAFLARTENKDLAHRLGYTDADIEAYRKQSVTLKATLESFIQTIIDAGPFEFNSKPYAEYTVRALANLADLSEEGDSIKEKATQALDTIFYLHAKGSLNHHTYGPMRRRVNKQDPGVLSNYLTLLAQTWDEGGKVDDSQPKNDKLQFAALRMKYRPMKATMELMTNKGDPGTSSFDRIGHGYAPSSFFDRVINWATNLSLRSCPEIYFSGTSKQGKNYLLSAGGVSRTGSSIFHDDIYSHPPCLITGESTKIQKTFYLGDPLNQMIVDKKDKNYQKKLRNIQNKYTGEEQQKQIEKLDLEFKTEAVLKGAQGRNNTDFMTHSDSDALTS